MGVVANSKDVPLAILASGLNNNADLVEAIAFHADQSKDARSAHLDFK